MREDETVSSWINSRSIIKSTRRLTNQKDADETKIMSQGGSPGLVVMGRDSYSSGFESQHHILDGHFFTSICCKKL